MCLVFLFGEAEKVGKMTEPKEVTVDKAEPGHVVSAGPRVDQPRRVYSSIAQPTYLTPPHWVRHSVHYIIKILTAQIIHHLSIRHVSVSVSLKSLKLCEARKCELS